jgi:hypothetical protein
MRTAADFNPYYTVPDPWRVSHASFGDARSILGVDISQVAIERAKARDRRRRQDPTPSRERRARTDLGRGSGARNPGTGHRSNCAKCLKEMARETGLEPAASAVTGRRKINKINGLPYYLAAKTAQNGQKYFQPIWLNPAEQRLSRVPLIIVCRSLSVVWIMIMSSSLDHEQ